MTTLNKRTPSAAPSVAMRLALVIYVTVAIGASIVWLKLAIDAYGAWLMR